MLYSEMWSSEQDVLKTKKVVLSSITTTKYSTTKI